MTELKQRVALQATPLLITCLTVLVFSVLCAHAAVVKDLRIGNNTDYVRMVLEFDRPLNPPPAVTAQDNRLQVILTGIDNTFTSPKDGVRTDDLLQLDVAPHSETTHIKAVFSFHLGEIKTFALTGPHRFIIDAYRPLASEASNPSTTTPTNKPAISAVRVPPKLAPTPEKPVSASISGAIAGASLTRYRTMATDSMRIVPGSPDQFQQQLIVALIVVTTVIVILLFFIIWISGEKGRATQSVWMDQLPPTNDRDIETLDSVIRKRLKACNRT